MERSDAGRETWTAPPDAVPPVAPDGPFRPGTVIGDRFRLDRLMGSGGAGTVYAAFDLAVGQEVAVKLIRSKLMCEETRVRLQREVQAARGGHPGLITVHDLHQVDGLWLLSMELVEGPSVRELVRQRGRLTVEEVVGLGRQVAESLADLHRRGLVHRDVKPGNILVRPDGSAVLCDLGLARPLDHGLTVTQHSDYVGTPAYMAPEQVLGGETSDRVDVYALGLSLLECLTGTVPAVASTPVATALKRQAGRPPSSRRLRPDCPAWLDRLLAWMLEPDPRARPDAARVASLLAARRVRPRLRRVTARWLAAAVLVGVVAAAVGRTVWLGRTVRVETLGQTVRGVDRRGGETWSYTLSSPIREVERADLTDDGLEDVVVVTYPDNPAGGLSDGVAMSEVMVVTRRGTVVTRVRPEELVTSWSHPFAKRFTPTLAVRDIDGDRVHEVILNCRQRNFYPNHLLVFWTRAREWDVVLDHSGYLFDAVPVPDSDPPALRFLALNNRLAMLPVLGEILLTPPDRHRSTLLVEEALTVEAGSSGGGRTSSLSQYVPLEPRIIEGCTQRVELSVTADGGTRISCREDTDLDRFGNPVAGPNAGRDLRRQRLELMAGLHHLRYPGGMPRDPEAVRQEVQQLAEGIRPLLAELPSRAVLTLAGALALAEAGDLSDARSRLEVLALDAPYDDVLFRLAHFEALTGDVDAAVQRALHLAREGTTGRARFDAPDLLLRLAIEGHDPALLDRALEALNVQGLVLDAQPGLASTVKARANLWWDELDETDVAVRSWAYAPDGDSVACLARWRLGRQEPEDERRMREAITAMPDAAAEARLALAAVLLDRGASSAALAVIDDAAATLEPEARTDFCRRQLFDLGRGLRSKALLAAGRPAEARVTAGALLARATPGLLPAILADEVLKATGQCAAR